MGNCAGKPKTVDGVKPEAADQVADDAKATILNSSNGETTAEDKDDAKATNENGEKKDEKTEPVIGLLDTKEEAEDIKKPALVNDELKTEAPAEAEKVAEEKVEEKKLEVST